MAFVMGNSPGTSEFPAQRTCNTENVSISWRRHEVRYLNADSPHTKFRESWFADRYIFVLVLNQCLVWYRCTSITMLIIPELLLVGILRILFPVAERKVFHLPLDELSNGKIPGDLVGVVRNIVELTPGVRGKALPLNGVDQWVTLGNHRDR